MQTLRSVPIVAFEYFWKIVFEAQINIKSQNEDPTLLSFCENITEGITIFLRYIKGYLFLDVCYTTFLGNTMCYI